MRWRRAVDIPVLDHFDLEALMDSGQLFRWRPLPADAATKSSGSNAGSGDPSRTHSACLPDAAYVGVVDGQVWKAYQRGTHFWCEVGTSEKDCSGPDPDESEATVRRYFDLDTDYAGIISRLHRRDRALRPVLERRSGLRILRQDPWETLVTFILSSNNNMPRIRMLVDRIARAFGNAIGELFSRFPAPSALAEVGEGALRELGVGYRAPYVAEAAKRVYSGELDLQTLKRLPTAEAREELMALPGVGRKVADCVLLFGLEKRDVFPLDVWAKRAVERVYFGGDKRPLTELQAFVADRFGADAGDAQNYLFNDVRLSESRARSEGGSGNAHEAPSRGHSEDAQVTSVRR